MPVLGQFSGHILQPLTLKFSLDLKLKISMMSFASETFHCSLLFLSLFTIICQTFAKPSQDVANSTSVPKQTQHCNKEIAKLLQKITKQLTQVQNDVNILKGNKTSSKGKALTSVIFLVLTNRLQIFMSSGFYFRNKDYGQFATSIQLSVYQKFQRQNFYPFFLRKRKELQIENHYRGMYINRCTVKYPAGGKLVKNNFNNFYFVTLSCVSTAKKNCAELYKSGEKLSGVYSIDPDGSGAFDVFCDQKTGGGGWTVFQKRLDGSVDFYRGWNDYKRGFGNLNGEFWLGLDKIHRLTKTRNKLRVDLEDTTGNAVYAEYDMFAVTSERTKYQLSLGTYSGEELKKGPRLKSFSPNNFDLLVFCFVSPRQPTSI